MTDVKHGLPTCCKEPLFLFPNEHAICEQIAADPFLWMRLGCLHPVEYRRWAISPDFWARIRGGKPDSPERLGVEVEKTYRDFIKHGHSGLNIHLVITLKANGYRRSVRSVPMISMYRKMDDDWYHWSLDDDIDMLFRDKESRLFPPAPEDEPEVPLESLETEG